MYPISRHSIRNLAQADQGAVALIFAISMLVMFGVTGLAVDSARGYGAKSQLQNALDASTLATARRLAEHPNVDFNEVFNAFFNQTKPDDRFSVASLNVTKVGNEITAEVTGTVQTMIMGIMGKTTMTIAARSVAEFGLQETELVMALDNTGSMAGRKLDTLKTAAHDLVNTLERGAVDPNMLRIGIVPFSQYVNVGLQYRNEPWIDVPADSVSSGTSCGDTYPNATYTNCRDVQVACVLDGIPSTCTQQQCDVNLGTPVNVCTPYSYNNTWHGCVGSRAYPLNLRDADYATRIPGLINYSCSTPLTPLTTDRSIVRNAIDAMSASGDTYIPDGVMWGWRTLSPTQPFAESQSGGNPRVKRFLIVMTDGVNSVSPDAQYHWGTDTALSNSYTTEACTNVKTDQITVFTIAFEVPDIATKDLLRACASSPGQFFDATDSSALLAAFDAIGTQMASLRIKN